MKFGKLEIEDYTLITIILIIFISRYDISRAY